LQATARNRAPASAHFRRCARCFANAAIFLRRGQDAIRTPLATANAPHPPPLAILPLPDKVVERLDANAWANCQPTEHRQSRMAGRTTPGESCLRGVPAFDAGADAVLGRIDLDGEGKLLPEALHRSGALEGRYEQLLTELSWLLDPLEHNPWPHHSTISGATLGVSRSAYCRVGRMPRVALGEDKALIAVLLRQDARIRYSPTIRVITSGRTHGRAPGGVADTLAIRSKEPEAFCDEALEPYHTAFARALWRGRLRRLHAAGRLAVHQDWAEQLALSARDVNDIIKESPFGAAWNVIEDRSSLFARQLLRPAELPEQIALARRSLSLLREGGSAARQDVQTKFSISIRPLDDACRSHSFDEESDGLVAT
jgi:hypothetical protein